MEHKVAGVVQAVQWRGDNLPQMRQLDPGCGSFMGRLKTSDEKAVKRGEWLVRFAPNSLAVLSAEAFKRIRETE